MKGTYSISFHDAEAAPLRHKLVVGKGFVEALPLLMPLTGDDGRCDAPQGALDDSLHILTSPQGGEIVFRWKSRANAWVVNGHNRLIAHRLGFAPDYLSRNGWRYKGIYEPEEHNEERERIEHENEKQIEQEREQNGFGD